MNRNMIIIIIIILIVGILIGLFLPSLLESVGGIGEEVFSTPLDVPPPSMPS